MPIVKAPDYHPPPGFTNPHLQTIFPALLRRVTGVVYQRERIDTPDGDFLDLDWSRVGSPRLVVISHGLEGNSHRSYVLGMVRAFNRRGWDALAWNFRGCSGEMNRKPQFYHSGASYDLDTVIQHVLDRFGYQHLALVGFSMGGNMTLKYLGERAENIPHILRAAVAISVPCELVSSARKMDTRLSNRLYLYRFLRMLRKKVEAKARLFPEALDPAPLRWIRSFRQFDDLYTAPLHGFKDALDYWQKASAKPLLAFITVPTLLLNALDDPFLTPECFPFKEAGANPYLYLQAPRHGGHVGFVQWKSRGEYWSEERAIQFVTGQLDLQAQASSVGPQQRGRRCHD